MLQPPKNQYWDKIAQGIDMLVQTNRQRQRWAREDQKEQEAIERQDKDRQLASRVGMLQTELKRPDITDQYRGEIQKAIIQESKEMGSYQLPESGAPEKMNRVTVTPEFDDKYPGLRDFLPSDNPTQSEFWKGFEKWANTRKAEASLAAEKSRKGYWEKSSKATDKSNELERQKAVLVSLQKEREKYLPTMKKVLVPEEGSDFGREEWVEVGGNEEKLAEIDRKISEIRQKIYPTEKPVEAFTEEKTSGTGPIKKESPDFGFNPFGPAPYMLNMGQNEEKDPLGLR